jgi:membrane protein DedA with SNARE-associated domain
MIIEGPIISVISGFMVYLGFLNIYIIYPLLVLGDIIGDSIYYSIGRYGKESRIVKKIISFLGYDEASEKFLIDHFSKHTNKTLILAKIFHGIGIPVQISAGVAKVNFKQYLIIETGCTIVKTFILLIIGFYLGNSYQKIDNIFHFIGSVAIATLSLVLVYIILSKRIKRYLSAISR